jgi:hypothetical protein
MPRSFKYHCDHCDFEQSLIANRDYGYVADDGRFVEMFVGNAWCEECCQVAHAEYFLDEAEIADRIASTTSRRTRKGYECYRQLLAERGGGPRCLQCGGVDLIRPAVEGVDWTMPHPACGGALSRTSTALVRLEEVTYLYSQEGYFLTTVPGLFRAGDRMP